MSVSQNNGLLCVSLCAMCSLTLFLPPCPYLFFPVSFLVWSQLVHHLFPATPCVSLSSASGVLHHSMLPVLPAWNALKDYWNFYYSFLRSRAPSVQRDSLEHSGSFGLYI